MLNSVCLQGRIANDLDLKQTQSGIDFLRFTLAVDDDYKSKDAAEKKCQWIEVHAWRKTAELLCNYMSKGSMILVQGRIETNSWTDNNGQKRYSTYVTADRVNFVGSKNSGNAAPAARPVNVSYDAPAAAPQQNFEQLFEDDDELPF